MPKFSVDHIVFHSHSVSRGLPCVAFPVLTGSSCLSLLSILICFRGSHAFQFFIWPYMSISDSRYLAGLSFGCVQLVVRIGSHSVH